MKYFRNFEGFQKYNLISEQQKKVQGSVDEPEFEVKPRGTKGSRLPYTKKSQQEVWKGENYEKVWKKAVVETLNDPEKYKEVLNYLKTYKGEYNEVVQELLSRATGEPKTKNLIKRLATDGKIGPFHNIVRSAMTKTNQQDVIIPQPNPEGKKFKVTVKSNPQDGGTVSGGGDYDENSEVTVKAQEAEGKVFKNWTEADKEVSKDGEYKFTITKNIDLVANFDSEEEEKEEEDKKEEGGDEDDTPSFDRTDTGEQNKGPFSERTVGTTGDLGEKEKQQIKFEVKGGTPNEKILSFNYPQIAELRKNESLKIITETPMKDRKRTEKEKKDVYVKTDGKMYTFVTYKLTLDWPDWVKYVYILNNIDDANSQTEFYNTGLNKRLEICKLTKGKLQMIMYATSFELKVETEKVTKDGVEFDVLKSGESEKLQKFLKEKIKPFAENEWNGPSFVTKKVSFNFENYDENKIEVLKDQDGANDTWKEN